MKIAEEWKHAWKWLQTWLITVLSFAPMVYAQFSELQAYLPTRWFTVGIVILWAATMINAVRKKRV